jgi:hypothetical protein
MTAIECLPSKCQALSSNLNTTKNKIIKRRHRLDVSLAQSRAKAGAGAGSLPF